MVRSACLIHLYNPRTQHSAWHKDELSTQVTAALNPALCAHASQYYPNYNFLSKKHFQFLVLCVISIPLPVWRHTRHNISEGWFDSNRPAWKYQGKVGICKEKKRMKEKRERETEKQTKREKLVVYPDIGVMTAVQGRNPVWFIFLSCST